MRFLLNVLKIVIPLGIIAYLLLDLPRSHPQAYENLQHQSKRWDLLGLGVLLVLTANCLAFYRWYLLVRALGLPFSVHDAFRLGFVGFLLNFVSLGHVGGDLFKAIFLFREQRSRRSEAVATILIDRVMGMLGLVLVATCVLFWLDLGRSRELTTLAYGVRILAIVMSAGVLALVLLDVRRISFLRRLDRVRWIGPVWRRGTAALDCYRRNHLVLVVAVVMSVGVHLLIGGAVYLASAGLLNNPPTLIEHLIIVPLANIAGALPVAPMGLGQFEAAMEFLFHVIPAEGRGDGMGIVIALCYRIMTIAVAPIGLVYYVMNRAMVRELMSEAQSTTPAETAIDERSRGRETDLSGKAEGPRTP